jgi:hypothetical protein
MKKRQAYVRLFVVFATLTNFLAESESLRHVENHHAGTIDRKLFGVCEDGSEPVVHYFEVIVRIQPDISVTGICTLADQIKLGSDINSILSSHVSMSLCIVLTFIQFNNFQHAIGDWRHRYRSNSEI